MFRKPWFHMPFFTVLDRRAGCVQKKKADRRVLLSGRDFDVHWTQSNRAMDGLLDIKTQNNNKMLRRIIMRQTIHLTNAISFYEF